LPENAAAVDEDGSSSDEDDSTQTRPISPTRTHSPTRLIPQVKPPTAKPRKSFAERLAKSQRDESMLPRVTAYCTCEAYKLLATQTFLTEQHGVKGAVIYDEALYGRYELPLRTGEGGFRVKSGELRVDESSDSEGPSKPNTNGDTLDEEGTVGSSAILEGTMEDEGLLFSPPKNSSDGHHRSSVHFLDEEEERSQEQSELPLKRRDSTPIDPNALSNLAEGNPLEH
jgi:uncharacterized Rmd1/YagE family protein